MHTRQGQRIQRLEKIFEVGWLLVQNPFVANKLGTTLLLHYRQTYASVFGIYHRKLCA